MQVTIHRFYTNTAIPTSNVFLGLGLDKQDKDDESAKAYRAATQIKHNNPLAWQGLITLYEKQAGKYVEDHQDATVHLAELFMEAYVEQPGDVEGYMAYG